MCTRMTRYFNRYTSSWQYAKCGKCPSCQQEKAFIRTSRLKNATFNLATYTPFFVTLTYRNAFMPYIRRDELLKDSSRINVYRDASIRRVRISSVYDMAYRFKRETRLLETFDSLEHHIYFSPSDVAKLKKLRGQADNDKISICYFKDVQDFEKRLRIILSRRFGITSPLYSFKCSEYGPSTQRSHFHLLLYLPSKDMAQCTRAICEAWPYDSQSRKEQSIQIARNPQSYVSSYVNRHSDFPFILSLNPFKPRHSISKGFGFQSHVFGLPYLLQAIGRGNLDYLKSRTRSDGSTGLESVPIPDYVLNRYFYKFKGYSRLSYDHLRELVMYPDALYTSNEQLYKLGFLNSKDYYNLNKSFYNIDWDKVRQCVNCIKLRYRRFLEEFVIEEDGIKTIGLPDNVYSRELFADYYYRVWRVKASNTYKSMFKDVQNMDDYLEIYYNLDELKKNMVRSVDIALLVHRTERDKCGVITDPNLFHRTINRTEYYTIMFDNTFKRRKVTNEVMSRSGIYV